MAVLGGAGSTMSGAGPSGLHAEQGHDARSARTEIPAACPSVQVKRMAKVPDKFGIDDPVLGGGVATRRSESVFRRVFAVPRGTSHRAVGAQPGQLVLRWRGRPARRRSCGWQRAF